MTFLNNIRSSPQRMGRMAIAILALCGLHLALAAQETKNRNIVALQKWITTAETALELGYRDSARRLFHSIIQHSTTIKYTEGLVKGFTGLGLSESNAGNLERALAYYDSAIRICDTSLAKNTMLPSVYNNIAIIYHLQSNYNKAIQYYLKAISIREQMPTASIALEKLYSNIAALLNDIQQYDKTLFYLKKSEKLAQARGNYNMLASIAQNLGTTYAEINDTTKSKAYFLKSLQISQEHHIPNLVHKSYVNLANLALKQEQPAKAIAYLQEAMATKGDIFPYYRSGEAATLGRAYLKVNNKPLAIQHTKRALSIAEQYHIPRDQQDAHKLLSLLYSEQRNYKLAYEHQHKAWQLSDSINDMESRKAIVRMETGYRSAMKDKRLAENELLINKQQGGIYKRNIWIGIALTCLVAALIFIILLKKSYKHKQALKDERVQRLIKQQEIKEMKSIIDAEEKERNRIANDLHDGIMIEFSVVKMNMAALLNDRQYCIPKIQIEPVIRQLDNATRSLRKAAHYLMPDMLLDNGLFEAVLYLCNSLKEDVPFQIHLEQLDPIPRLGIQFELAIYRIIQELLQNIIKHAQATEVYIQLSCHNQHLGIDVEDNGIGFSHSEAGHKGLGLKSIKARVQSLNGAIHIDSGSKGSSIGLEFNLEQV